MSVRDLRDKPSRDGAFDLSTLRERLTGAPRAGDTEVALKRAAVAAVLRESDSRVGAELLFIRRTENPRDPWSGHMAFPGGRHDPTDASLLETALRETHEEVGLDLRTHATLLTRLPDVPAIARGRQVGMVIAPFVFALDRAAGELVVDASEVAELLWVPLGSIARGEGAGTIEYVHENVRYELPCIRVAEGRVVWGLTHQMVHLLLDALAR